MAPASFVVLSDFPLNAHGKMDREALSRMEIPSPNDTSDIPQHRIDSILGQIWAEALGREIVASGDNFFDMGGDSLSAMIIAAKVRHELNFEVRLQLFSENPTLFEMARFIENRIHVDANVRQ